MATGTARQEWAANWRLPLLAAVGIAGSAIFAYSSGVFMTEMTREFGWTRSQFSAAFAVQTVLGLIVMPLVGRLTDRIGPRRVGLAGIFLAVATFSSLGLANGTTTQWWLLGGLQAIGNATIANPVWLSAVVPRFRVARGLALAVSLAGIGVATAVWPVLAAIGIEHIGWRATFPALVLGWAAVALPFAWFCLKDPPPRDPVVSSGGPPPPTYLQALRSRTFVCVTLAGGVFASVTYGLILHLVPLLQQRGLTLTEAAGMASVMGLFAIGGRLATGLLLDRLPTRPLSIAVFMLPVGVCLLLWLGGGSPVTAIAAVALLGLATGSETDVVVYIVARRFGQEIFASVFGSVGACFALLAATGPLLAGGLYDSYGSYDPYLMLGIPLGLLAALLVALVPPAPTSRHAH